MPQVFKIGSYWVYFWANEGKPLEPVHVHVSEGKPTENATKIWVTSSGKTYLCNNNSHIPDRVLRNIMRITEARVQRYASNPCIIEVKIPFDLNIIIYTDLFGR